MLVKFLVVRVFEVFLLMYLRYKVVNWGLLKRCVWFSNMNVLLGFKFFFKKLIYVFFKVGIVYFLVVYRVVMIVFGFIFILLVYKKWSNDRKVKYLMFGNLILFDWVDILLLNIVLKIVFFIVSINLWVGICCFCVFFFIIKCILFNILLLKRKVIVFCIEVFFDC